MPPLASSRFALPILLALTAMPLRAQASAGVSVDSSLGHRRIQLLPALGSAPETGLQYGVTVFVVSERPPIERTRPFALLAYAIRTAKSQTRVGVEAERWTRGNARRVAGTLV